MSSPIVLIGDRHSLYYSQFVSILLKKFPDARIEILHEGIGITGEAGELADALKKVAVYGQEPDIPNIVEEIGDCFFFLQAIMNRYNLRMDAVIQANADKLQARYEKLVYSDKAAEERADKK